MVLGIEDAVNVLNKWKDDSAQILIVSESPTNQLDLQVRWEVQQFLAGKLLAYHNLDALVEPNQMKNGLAEINADRV